MKTYEEFRERVRRLKSERWLDILEVEGPGRVPGRRPRDPEQEALLLESDRLRLARRDWWKHASRRPVPEVDEA